MTIGQRIKQERIARGLTQRALGDLAGIAEPTVRKYESDRLHPKYETLEKLAAPLQVTAAYLRDGKKRLGDQFFQPNSEEILHLRLDPQAQIQLVALSEKLGLSPDALAEKLLSDAVFAELDRALQNPNI